MCTTYVAEIVLVVLVGGAGELEHTARRHHGLAHPIVETSVHVDHVTMITDIGDLVVKSSARLCAVGVYSDINGIFKI